MKGKKNWMSSLREPLFGEKRCGVQFDLTLERSAEHTLLVYCRFERVSARYQRRELTDFFEDSY